MKGVNIFLAQGFEEIEALAVADILRRGGVSANLVSITDDAYVCSSRGLSIGADMLLDDIQHDGQACREDVMVFPGGMPGSSHLGSCDKLMRLMNEHYRQGGSVAAICAAPDFVLSRLDGIGETDFTCYDGCEATLISLGARFVRKPAVVSGRIITGRGPGHAIEFGLAILGFVKGEEAAARVSSAMILNCD